MQAWEREVAVERRVLVGVWGWRKGEMSMVGKVGGGVGEGMVEVEEECDCMVKVGRRWDF